MPDLDMSAHYRVHGYRGVAFYLTGYAKAWSEESWTHDCVDPREHSVMECPDLCYLYNEPEEYEDERFVTAIMVGDDREHIIDVDDLEVIPEDGFCRECGQTGCTYNVYE